MELKIKKKKKRSIVENVLCSLTALFLILNCQSVWQNSTTTNYHIYEICFSLIVLYCIYYPVKYGIIRELGIYAISVSMIYMLIILLMVLFSVSSDNLVRFLSRFISFPLFMIGLSSGASRDKKLMLFSKFVNWVAIIAWISVVFWFLSTFGLIKPTGAITTGWSGAYTSYYGLYFSNNFQRLDFMLQIRRNIGIFTEGPMYMIVLVFAMIISQVINEYYPIRKIQVIGIITALILIGSVTGYMTFVFIVGIQLIHRFKEYRTKIIIGMGAVIAGILFGYILLVAKSQTASFYVRMNDFLAGFKAWLEHPVLGNGYENVDRLREYMASNREGNYGFSNTIFAVLAYGGIVFLIPYIVPVMVGFFCSRRIGDYKLSVFCIVYFMLYFAVIFYTFYINFYIWAFLISIPIAYKEEKRQKYHMILNFLKKIQTMYR